MKLVKLTINSDVTLEASALSAADLAQLMILVSKCRICGSVYDRVGKDWVTEYYLKDVSITMARADTEVFEGYEAAKANLVAREAAATAAALVMSEPETV